MWEALIVEVSNWGDIWALQIDKRHASDWLLFFAPVLLLEIPQYYFPIVAIMLARAFGFPRTDERRTRGLMARKPLVSVVVAGRNESAAIGDCIRSLVDQDYPNLEIIIVDDASTDETYAIARKFARKGLIRVIRNRESVGRTGRPTASNLGTRVSNGEFIISLDADTTFDRGLIENMLAPFADPSVGAVAGNVLVRNISHNIVTRFQALEYFVSIDLRKRWSDLIGNTLQASGAIGAFRRSAIMPIFGWDPELAEDGDISLRIIKSGWKIGFAPRAVAMTDAPDTWRVLMKQRYRWDRGALRTYLSKHGRLLRPSISGPGYAYAMWGEILFSNVLPLFYPIYLVWLAMQGMGMLTLVLALSYALYSILAVLSLGAIRYLSDRSPRFSALLLPAILCPLYRELMRWVRFRALVAELLRRNYKDSYLPDSAWMHTPRY